VFLGSSRCNLEAPACCRRSGFASAAGEILIAESICFIHGSFERSTGAPTKNPFRRTNNPDLRFPSFHPGSICILPADPEGKTLPSHRGRRALGTITRSTYATTTANCAKSSRNIIGFVSPTCDELSTELLSPPEGPGRDSSR
jgi:hypothetical protein